MKTRILYALLGAILATVVMFGAMQLRAQSNYSGPKWEYAWVSLKSSDPHFGPWPLESAYLNGHNLNPTGNVFDVFNQLGSDGWEYIEQNNGYFVFKRPVQ